MHMITLACYNYDRSSWVADGLEDKESLIGPIRKLSRYKLRWLESVRQKFRIATWHDSHNDVQAPPRKFSN